MLLNSEMGQQWNQGRNQKLPWDKWKWTHNSKSVGHSKSSPNKREIHSNMGLLQEARKTQTNSLTLFLKKLETEWQTRP